MLMRTVKSIGKALGADLTMPKPGKKSRKARAYGLLGFFAFAGIMVPASIMVGYITYLLSNLLMFFGERSYALISLVHIISAFTMIFCIPVMFNVLYFTKDLSFFASLPIKPVQLYRAKFIHSYKTESFMTALVLFAMFIGWIYAMVGNYGASEAFSPVRIIASVSGLFIIPALPLMYCSIICTVLMKLFRRAKRISVFYHASTVLFIVFAFVFLLSFRGQGGTNIEKYVDMLVAGNNSFNDLCDILFFTTPMVCRAMGDGNILMLVLSLVTTFVVYGVMVALAVWLYRDGLYTAAALGGRKARRVRRDGSMRPRSVFTSLVRKETIVLMRTMSYRTNCVYANLIWPVLSVVFFALSKSNVNLLRFIALYRGGQARAYVIVLVCVLGLSFIAAGLNSIASTSFTREGAHIDLIKYIPVKTSVIAGSKAVVNILFTYIPLSAAILFAAYALGTKIGYILLYLGLSFLCVVIATAVGVCMDSVTPFTVWPDEATALRGNMNCFFNLAIGLVIAALVCGGTYGLYIWKGSVTICVVSVAGLLVLMTVFGILWGLRFVRRNIDSL